jgi:hypothetical protein
VTWGTWPNCKQTGKPLFWSEVPTAKEAPNNAPSLQNTTQWFGCMNCTQKLEDNRSAAKEAQKIPSFACANQSKDSKLHLSLPQMHSPNSAIWLDLIWVPRNRATKDGETTYMRKNWHPVPTPWLFRSCSILVKMTSLLCLGQFIFSISLFLHCTTPWSGITMAQVLTVRVLLFMSIVKNRTICFVSEVKGSQVQQVGIPPISLQSQGSTLLWPLGFQFRSLLIFY